MALRKTVTTAKGMTWSRLIEDLNHKIFGQVTIIKIGIGRSQAKKLFPTVESVRWGSPVDPTTPPTLFHKEKLVLAVKRLKAGNTAGLDDIPPEIAKAVVREQAETFLRIINHLIRGIGFPPKWKETKLVLIKKTQNSAPAELTIRPICLINTLEKVAVDMICNRISIQG